MTAPDLTAIRERCERATTFLQSSNGARNEPYESFADTRVVGWKVPTDVAGLSDGLFRLEDIKQLVSDIPALIAEIERLRKALETIFDAAESDIEPREYFAGIALAALAAVRQGKEGDRG
jgi:hypothetical protein